MEINNFGIRKRSACCTDKKPSKPHNIHIISITELSGFGRGGIQAQVVIMASYGSRYNVYDSSVKYDVDRMFNT